MKIPRDLSGNEFARLLRRFGYEITRQTGSHIRLTSRMQGSEHHVTVPAHDSIRVGTLSQILGDIAAYLNVSKEKVAEDLFEH